MHWYLQRVAAMLGPSFTLVGPLGGGSVDGQSGGPTDRQAAGPADGTAGTVATPETVVFVAREHAAAVIVADGSAWSAERVAALLAGAPALFQSSAPGVPVRIQCIVLCERGLPRGIGQAVPRLDRVDGDVLTALHVIDGPAQMVHSGQGASWLPPQLLLDAWLSGPPRPAAEAGTDDAAWGGGFDLGRARAAVAGSAVGTAGAVRAPLLTYGLLGAMAALHVLGLRWGGPVRGLSWLAAYGGQLNLAVLWLGEWWRPLTAIFLHANLLHIGMNSLALWQLGPVIEGTFGRRRLAVIWLASGLCGNWLYLWFGPLDTWSVGASGAIFGLFGALVVLGLRLRSAVRSSFWWQIAVTLGINIYIGLTVPAINMWAHAGGFVGGLVWAGAMVLTEPGPRRRGALAAATLGTAALAVAAYLQL